MADDFQDIILRFTAEDDEGKRALLEFAALLKAVGLETAEPEVDVKGLAKSELDLGKFILALKAIDGSKATSTISTRTDEGQKAISLFKESLQQLNDLDVEVRPEVDTEELDRAKEDVKELKKQLSRQKSQLRRFTDSDKFTRTGGKIRANKIRNTEKDLAAALAKFEELKKAAESKFEVNLNTLQARTELHFLRDNLQELAKLVVSPEVRLNDEDARRTAARIRAIMQEITRLAAHPEIDIHDPKFNAKVLEIKKEMLNLQHLVATPEIDLQGETDAKRIIASVSDHLIALGVLDVEPEIDLKGAPGTIEELQIVKQAMKDLDGKNVSIDVHTKGRIERLGGILGAIKAAFGAAREEAQSFTGAIGRVSVSFGAFTARLGPALIAVLFLLGGAILTIVGGLAALASSAILAAGAVGAMAIAFGAALAPAVLLAIALFSRLAKIIEALKQQELSRQQQQQQAVAGDQQRVASMRAIGDAAENLRRAQDNLAQATVDANREMADSYERVKDAVLALQHAELDRERAHLGLERSKLELKQFREDLGLTGKTLDEAFKKFTDISVDFKPTNLTKLLGGRGIDKADQLDLEEKILNVRDAQLSVKDANDKVKDSETELTRARQDNLKFQKEGIKASQGYAAALLAVADAQKALARAHDDQKMLAAQAKSIVLAQNLNKEERKTLNLLGKIKDAFKKAFDPVLAPIWDSIQGILAKIPNFLEQIGPAMAVLGFTLGKILEAFGNALASPAVAKAFSQFAIAAAALSGSAARVLIDLFTILGRVAIVAMPFLVDLAGKFADILDQWAAWAKKPGNLETLIQTLVDNLLIWLDIAFQLARVFIGFLSGANGPGQKFARWIADSLRHLGDLLATKKGRQDLIDWLNHAVSSTIKLARTIVIIIQLLGIMAIPVEAAMTQILTVFRLVRTVIRALQGAIKLLLDDIKLHWDIFNKILQGWPEKILKKIGELLSAIPGLASDAFNAAKSIGKNLVDGIVKGLKDQFLVKKGDIKGLLKKFLVNGPLQFLKIGSPSKVWADMGHNLVRGMEVGLNRGTKSLSATVSHTLAVPALKSPVPALAGTVHSGPTRGGDTIQHNEFNIQSPGGRSPDEQTMISQIERRLRRIR